MNLLQLTIHKIKNISHGVIELPIENDIYAIIGSNGVGKSTIMSCLAQLLSAHNLGQLKPEDYSSDSYVQFYYNEQMDKWYCSKNFWVADTHPNNLKFNGTYEGSLFYGFRFKDSKNVDELFERHEIKDEFIVNADDYIQTYLGKILHNDGNYYKGLKRIKNKKIAEKLNLKNTPYFIETSHSLISQYRMSSGECLLISLLHFIYNSLVRRSLPQDKPILMLIDEIELALHPVAVSNLINFLYELVKEYNNLTVILTSHASEVIRKIKPTNLYKLERVNTDENNFNIVNPCYPSYAIRDLYSHDGYDFLLLVEDELLKKVVKNTINNLKIANSRLINIIPVGGWENVLKLQEELVRTNTLGFGKQICSILDGDISEEAQKKYKRLKKIFLPVSSIEKFLYKNLLIKPDIKIKKELNDYIFTLQSIDQIISEYKEEEKKRKLDLGKGYTDGKNFYKKLLKILNDRNISEEEFIEVIYKVLIDNIDLKKFCERLREILS